jgi:hypothetical protein
MSNQISRLEKINSDRMIKESNAERDAEQAAYKDKDRKDKKPLVRNNDSDVAPEKDQNDVLRHHE